jgi:hypothetical protein
MALRTIEDDLRDARYARFSFSIPISPGTRPATVVAGTNGCPSTMRLATSKAH